MQRTALTALVASAFVTAALSPVALAQCEVGVLDDAGGPTFGSDYGRAVSLFGTRCVHGPGQGTPGPGSGRVVSHVWDGTNWVFEQTVFPSGLANFDGFGRAIAVNDDWLAVGAPGRDDGANNAGAVWIYRRDAGVWVEDLMLTAPAPQDEGAFGTSLALDGDTLVIGERGGTSNGTGAVWVYVRSAGSWVQSQSFTPTGLSPSSDFGYAVACEDDLLAVSAELDGTLAGEVRVYERNDAASPYLFLQTLSPTNGYVGDIFGESIDIDAERILVGAPASTPFSGFLGAAHLFERSVGATYAETRVFADASVGVSHWHGFDVAIDGDVVAVSAPLGDVPFQASSGTVSLWRKQGPTWRFDETITRNDVEINDRFGETVVIDGDWMAVGAPWVDTPGTDAGITLLYSLGCDVDLVPSCGGNPPGSIVLMGGRPAVGRAVTVGVTNTQFTQQPGALTLLMLSTKPAPGPCGLPLPGWSMYGPLIDGELRIDVLPPNPFQIRFGAPWAGFAQPSPFTIAIPADPSFVGDAIHLQGALIDPTSTFAPFSATASMRLEIGPN